MVYVLLLRGINVGGKNKVIMSELKKKLLDEGFEKVDSYINSGNLFFSSALSPENCISKIAQLLDRNYDFSIPFAVISREEYLEERAALPDWWQEDLARRFGKKRCSFCLQWHGQISHCGFHQRIRVPQ